MRIEPTYALSIVFGTTSSSPYTLATGGGSPSARSDLIATAECDQIGLSVANLAGVSVAMRVIWWNESQSGASGGTGGYEATEALGGPSQNSTFIQFSLSPKEWLLPPSMSTPFPLLWLPTVAPFFQIECYALTTPSSGTFSVYPILGDSTNFR